MSRPRVSIITPAYDQEAFIFACVESVLGQSFRSWEMIIVDDGSRDATPRIARRLARRDPRISVIAHGTNWGLGRLAETYNQALDRCRGRWVAVLEGDDRWPADKLARQTAEVEAAEIVLGYGVAPAIDSGGRVIDDRPIPDKDYLRYFEDFRGSALVPLLLRPCYIPAVTVMVRREILKRTGGFVQPPGVPAVDHPTWLRLSLEGPFLGSSRVLGYHRLHRQAQSLLRPVEGTKAEMAVSFFFLDEARRRQDRRPPSFWSRVRSAMAGSWSRQLVRAHWNEGRAALASGRKGRARRSFLRGLLVRTGFEGRLPGTVPARLACLLGFAFALTPLSLERLLDRLRGRRLSLYESLAREED
jgi:glycosyltransferase involved in cell wall biosynthesis